MTTQAQVTAAYNTYMTALNTHFENSVAIANAAADAAKLDTCFHSAAARADSAATAAKFADTEVTNAFNAYLAVKNSL